MDNKSTEQAQPIARPVMDIQPPQPTNQTPVADITPVAQEPTPVAQDTASSAPLPSEPVEAPAPTTEDTKVSEAPPVSQTAPTPLVAQSTAHKHSRMPMVAIVSAVVLASVLGTFAVFAYKDTSKKTPVSTTSQVAPVAQLKLAPSVVDDTTTAVDQSISTVDEAADYNDANLNDATLGL